MSAEILAFFHITGKNSVDAGDSVSTTKSCGISKACFAPAALSGSLMNNPG
jgi:hypothetical protein